jgi:hypothetical protein
MIAPLDSRLSILDPVNYFSTHLRPAKAKPYGYTFALITLFHVYLLMLDHHDHHFMSMHHLFVILWPPLLATYTFITCVAYA